MTDDVEEFMELVGTGRKTVYHFYIVSGGLIDEIRKEEADADADGRTWAIVWSNDIRSTDRRGRIIRRIREEIEDGKANRKDHMITWR
jgi:hypothetical protein